MAPADLPGVGRAGTDSRPMRQADLFIPTLAEYVSSWTRAYNRPPWVSARTARLRMQILSAKVLPEFGDWRLDAIGPADVTRWQAVLLARVGVGYVKFCAAAFAAPLRQAVREGLIAACPVEGLRWPRNDSEKPDPYSGTEMRRVWRWFAARKPALLPVVSLVCGCGMRPSEACGLRWQDVDLESGTAVIERSQVDRVVGRTKTERARRSIRLPDRVLEVLRGAERRGEWICVGRDGRPLASTSIHYYWRQGCDGAGVRYRGFYRARGGFMTGAIRRGANIWHVSEYTGTSPEMLSKHYVRWLGAMEVPGEPGEKRRPHREKSSRMSWTLRTPKGQKI